MLISFCIPCKNRTYDLKKVLPFLIKTANASPPVEIVIIDYKSEDDLEEYIKSVCDSKELKEPNILTYRKYNNHPFYRMAHARNLSVLASSGDYIIISSCDIIFHENFISEIRKLLEKEKPVWMNGKGVECIVVCQRQEFIDTGGYDERFVLYGPEDKDLSARLVRRGGKFITYPHQLIDHIHTPRKDKAKNYGVSLRARKMSALMLPYYEENTAKGTLVVNEDGWGSWE